MRWALVWVWNLFAALAWLALWPQRWLRRRSRPQFVRFRVSGDPPWRDELRPRWRRFGQPRGEVVSLASLERQLDLVADDERVQGVVLEVENLRVSAAKREMLADLFRGVRRRGKQVVGFALNASNSDYELLCSADRVFLAKTGRLNLIGFAVEASALGEGLRKLGVHADFVRRGEHKTAPELFTRESVSPIQRQTLEDFLEERYQELVRVVASGRRLEESAVRERIDRGPFSCRRAQAEGLCDGESTPAELGAAIGVQAEGDGLAVGSFRQYARSLPRGDVRFRPLRPPPALAWIELRGLIVDGEGGRLPGGAGLVGSETVARAVEAAARGPSPAIFLYVDSPGGSAPAAEAIFEAVKRAAAKKPVVAFFDRVAASGGYMAALGATEAWAAPLAVVGSIGVFSGKFDLSGLYQRLGIQRTVIVRGRNAALFSSSRGFTPHERESLEREVEETYQSFLEAVAHSRRKPKEEIEPLAEGRIFTGRRAAEVGLVDRVGGFEAAARRALELAGLSGAAFEVRPIPVRRRGSGLGRILGLCQQANVWAVWLPGVDLGETRPWG